MPKNSDSHGSAFKSKTARFRQRLFHEPGIVVSAGVYDALSARICELAGFEVVHHSGFGTAAVQLGMPDVGLLSMNEMSRQVAAISRAVQIPVLADGDNGFGNAINTYRTVQEYIRSGAVGMFLEDQVIPKRCGHMEGKQVISWEEMAGKLRAGMDARDELDPNFLIIYRTDAIAVNGFEDAMERAERAVELGVDMVFVEALETLSQIERVGKELGIQKKIPLMLNLIEGGKTPLVSYREAEEMGYRYVVAALTCLFTATKAMLERMKQVRQRGVSLEYADQIVSFHEFTQIVHLPVIQEMERKYLPRVY
ncbi:MAG: isocitrate lyase/PEP mutase family protein [Spirochaetes bacterium]|nr:isocitrate lyase/PEP mutase family protein [Spirochaetota bacterium]